MYDPLAGRFLQPDPVMQAPFWTQGLNRYAYVFNDPLNSTDPSGFIAEREVDGPSVTGGWITLGMHGAVLAQVLSFNVAGGGVGAGTVALGNMLGIGKMTASTEVIRPNPGQAPRARGTTPKAGGALGQNQGGIAPSTPSPDLPGLLPPGENSLPDGSRLAGAEYAIGRAIHLGDYDLAVRIALRLWDIEVNQVWWDRNLEENLAVTGTRTYVDSGNRTRQYRYIQFGKDSVANTRLLISVAGHEGVHVDQSRAYNLGSSELESAVNELEAYDFELRRAAKLGMKSGMFKVRFGCGMRRTPKSRVPYGSGG